MRETTKPRNNKTRKQRNFFWANPPAINTIISIVFDIYSPLKSFNQNIQLDKSDYW